MEGLPEKLREGIRKSSTLRLQSNLLRAGVDEKVVEAMDREKLIAAWAQLVADGKDRPVDGAAAETAGAQAAESRVLGYDPELEKEKLRFEREKFEMKMKAERDKLDLERAHLKFREQKEKDEPTRLKKYADALRGIIPKQTNDPVEVVSFFRNVERLFADFKVPKELQAAIIRPFLTERAKTLIAKLDPEKASKYEEVKNAILKEYKISAIMYRDKFNEVAKSDDQTYIMMTSNLFALLDGYTEARKIADFDDLKNLLVADRLKTTFNPTLLRHTLSIEAKSDKGWLPAYELAEIADNYVANYTDSHFPKSGSLGLLSKQTKPNVPSGQKPQQATKQTGGNENKAHSSEMSKPGQVKCYNCSGPHLVRFCDKKRNTTDRPNTNRINRVAQLAQAQKSQEVVPGDTAKSANVNSNYVMMNESGNIEITEERNDVGERHVGESDISCTLPELDVVHPLKYVKSAVAVVDGDNSDFRRVAALEDSGAEMAVISASVVHQLEGVVPMGHVWLSGICGTPVECPLVRLEVRMLQGDLGEPIPVEVAPRAVITCAVLEQSVDELVLPVAVIDCLRSMGEHCSDDVAGVNHHNHSENTDEVIQDHLLSVDNDEMIVGQHNDNVSDHSADNHETSDVINPYGVSVVTRSGLTTDFDNTRSQADAVDAVKNDSDASCNDLVVSDNLMSNTVSDNDVDQCDIIDADADAVHCGSELADSFQMSETRASLIDDQKNDASLKNCWSLLKRGKGNFCLQDGILMREEKILGQNFTQLVVPLSKREQVLEFGHDLAGHMSPKKCSQRIRLNFWWPTIKHDMINHAKQCKICQMRARKTCWDRVPIQATVRQEVPFTHWCFDILGPLSSEKLPYQYCLLLIDSMTRFPMAFAIKAPTAKNVCDCLVQTWSIFGVPRYVSADNATCNVALLTRELMKRFGVSPRFITPHHSEGNAAAERLIGTTKNLIAKVAAEHPRDWPKCLPFIMFALREVPSELTGVPPWVLAMGTLPRGPLAVLRETWTGERDLPPNLGKSPTEYLKELHQNLEIAKRYAESHSRRMQDVYVQRYNKRSKDKQFQVGDRVLILQPDSTASRMFSRWKGPGEVVVRQSPYSYIVELDGTRYRLHANQLRKFHVKVDAVRVDSLGLVGPDCVGLTDVVLTDVSSLSSEACLGDVGHVSAPCVDETAYRVTTCAIIHEEDADFGEIPSCKPPHDTNDSDNLLPSQRIDLNTLSHLSDNDRQLLLVVLDRYPDVFCDRPGLYRGVEHSIPVSPDFRPRRLKEYKIPEKIKPEVKRQIQELLDLGIIRKSNSPMASPLVCILKGPGGRDGVRLAVDFRYLNRYTISDAFPIPDVQDVVQKIGSSRWLTIADASQGYWQTAIRPEDQWKTGFICDDQLYEWTRTAFGMKSSGQTFCRAVQQVLEPVRDIVGSFVDDMVVHSFEFLKHLEDIDSFLTVIRNSGMTLKLRKCKFALPQLIFCGQIIGSGTRQPDPEKVAAIHAIKIPETKKQVRQIMGFFNYFRDSIPNFAALAQPITDLTKKSKSNKICWGVGEQRALDNLKSALQEATENVLYIIDQNKDFSLLVDASDHTVAGVLTQSSDEGIERPIAFFSWKLTKTQQGWSTVEKEAYAALRSLQRVKQWVFGHRITVFSDHNPLTYLTESAPKSAKLLRWSLSLQQFDVVFQYRAGKTHVVPDLLTRMCD